MILADDVAAAIARGEAAELCMVGPSKAYYIPRKLVGAGKLRKTGAGRGVRYTLG